MTTHLFYAIEKLLQPNTKDGTVHEEPISLKKLCKGDASWITQKAVLRWGIDTVKQVLTMPEYRKGKLIALIYTIPTSASQCSR